MVAATQSYRERMKAARAKARAKREAEKAEWHRRIELSVEVRRMAMAQIAERNSQDLHKPRSPEAQGLSLNEAHDSPREDGHADGSIGAVPRGAVGHC